MALVPWGDETHSIEKGHKKQTNKQTNKHTKNKTKNQGLQRNMWSDYGPNVDHQPVPIEQGTKLVPIDYYFISKLVGTKLSGGGLVPASLYSYFISVIVGIKLIDNKIDDTDILRIF